MFFLYNLLTRAESPVPAACGKSRIRPNFLTSNSRLNKIFERFGSILCNKPSYYKKISKVTLEFKKFLSVLPEMERLLDGLFRI